MNLSSSSAVVKNGASASDSGGDQGQASQLQMAEKEGIAEWLGSSSWDRQQLFGVLDDCLASGQ